MDDDRADETPGASRTRPADAPSPPPAGPDPRDAPPPPPPALPPAPPPPPRASGWPATTGWRPPDWRPGPRIDVGAVVGRTFDTYGREWSLFLVLALPAGLGALLQLLATPTYLFSAGSQATILDTLPETFWRDLAVLLAVGVVATLLSGLAALSMMVAADRLWRGQATGIGDALMGGLRAMPRVIGLWLLLAVILIGLAIVVGGVTLAAIAIAPTAGVLLLVLLLGVAGVGLILVEVRLSLILPVLLFEGRGVLESVGRTWGLTRGHAIMLLATLLVVGLAAGLGLWGSSLISGAVENRLVAGLATGIATTITAPLSAIWVTIAWGDLVGPGHADSRLMSRGTGRLMSVGLVLGFGGVLLVAGFMAFADYMARTTLPS